MDASDWRVKWALLSQQLSNELPPEAGAMVSMAFGLGFSNRLSALLERMNGRSMFTGTTQASNLQILAEALGAYTNYDSVRKLRGFAFVDNNSSSAMQQHPRDFFNTRITLRQRVIDSLSTSDFWYELLLAFSRTKPGYVTGSMINSIRISHNTPCARSEATLDKVFGWNITLEEFCTALYSTGAQNTANDVRAAAAGMPTPFIEPPVMPLGGFPVVVGKPQPTTTTMQQQGRKRLVDATKKLEDATAFAIARTPFLALEDDDEGVRLSKISFNVVKLCSSLERAEEIANEFMDEDVDEMDGEESKVKHSYAVWQFKTAIVPKKREVKNRTRTQKKSTTKD